MPNNLTGGYDAVAQIGIHAVNGIIATLHRNGISEDASPSFLHSFSVGISDSTPVVSEGIVDSGWLLKHWSDLVMQGAPDASVKSFANKSPPGVSAELSESLNEIEKAQADATSPGSVTGLAQIQLSTPTAEFADGATSEVTGRVQFRANYIPRPDTRPLPEPIHGDIMIRFSVHVQPNSLSNVDIVNVNFPDNDGDIQFIADGNAGLDSSDADEIQARIRAMVRTSFEPITLELPAAFGFLGFKALAGGQVLALPVQLTGAPAPASQLGGINSKFLASGDDFAVAVAQEYVLSLVQPSLDAIKAQHPQFVVSSFAGSATYTVNFTHAAASWVNGLIALDIQGNATTLAWWAPNVGSFSIQQNVALHFTEATETMAGVPQGQPAVNVNVNGPFGGLVEGMVAPIVRNTFIAERDKALAQVNADIQAVLSSAAGIDEALHSLDAHTDATFRELSTSQEGIVLHGDIATRYRPGPMVSFTETGDGERFSALQSWIPGGIIDRFEWTWLESKIPYMPWSNEVKTLSDDHRFVLPKPQGITHVNHICLHLTGRQVNPGGPHQYSPSIGSVSNVEGGDTCSADSSELVFVMPAWWDVIMTPIWLPDPPPESILEEAIAAHLEAVSRHTAETGANTVVHFAELSGEKPFDMLSEGFADFGKDSTPMALSLVLPRGSFRMTRRELEEQLGRLEGFSGPVYITEDYEWGWSKTFAVERPPATFFTNARGEFVWSDSGRFNAGAFALALDEHMIAAARPRPRALRLSVKVGDRAPDILMTSLQGERLALRKLRGRAVLLYFWQSWSKPCVTELLRLQQPGIALDKETKVIAVNVGDNVDDLKGLVRRYELDISIVSDPQRRNSERYGIRCWPTTVSIDQGGFINNIRLGRSPRQRRDWRGNRNRAGIGNSVSG